ncbi:MAG: hypothetical protein RR957_07385 [Oscillospiraceae bacterium]
MKEIVKSLGIVPRFVTQGYVIHDKRGFWGTDGAKLKPDAPQWAKDEYEKWKATQAEAERNNIKL